MTILPGARASYRRPCWMLQIEIELVMSITTTSASVGARVSRRTRQRRAWGMINRSLSWSRTASSSLTPVAPLVRARTSRLTGSRSRSRRCRYARETTIGIARCLSDRAALYVVHSSIWHNVKVKAICDSPFIPQVCSSITHPIHARLEQRYVVEILQFDNVVVFVKSNHVIALLLIVVTPETCLTNNTNNTSLSFTANNINFSFTVELYDICNTYIYNCDLTEKQLLIFISFFIKIFIQFLLN